MQETYLQPLADALTIHARIEDAKVEHDEAGYYVAGSIGALTLRADETGWALYDAEDRSHAYGAWFRAGEPESSYPPRMIYTDDETGDLDAGECDAAAHNLAQALPDLLP